MIIMAKSCLLSTFDYNDNALLINKYEMNTPALVNGFIKAKYYQRGIAYDGHYFIEDFISSPEDVEKEYVVGGLGSDRLSEDLTDENCSGIRPIFIIDKAKFKEITGMELKDSFRTISSSKSSYQGFGQIPVNEYINKDLSWDILSKTPKYEVILCASIVDVVSKKDLATYNYDNLVNFIFKDFIKKYGDKFLDVFVERDEDKYLESGWKYLEGI